MELMHPALPAAAPSVSRPCCRATDVLIPLVGPFSCACPSAFFSYGSAGGARRESDAPSVVGFPRKVSASSRQASLVMRADRHPPRFSAAPGAAAGPRLVLRGRPQDCRRPLDALEGMGRILPHGLVVTQDTRSFGLFATRRRAEIAVDVPRNDTMSLREQLEPGRYPGLWLVYGRVSWTVSRPRTHDLSEGVAGLALLRNGNGERIALRCMPVGAEQHIQACGRVPIA